ncbi:MAG: hypothetical protein RL112_2100 [Planctomycetota bacterium]|jgi:hypothetical protein
MKEIEITCPCCEAKLTVDVLTQKVMRTRRPEAGKERDPWAAASEKVRDRGAAGTDKLDRALSDEKDKHARLDDAFDKAREKWRREQGE